ncbi:alpha/beta fold hydrolase [Embleya sp. NPDC008237]|uniref:alpha/beta fold hydrolase n=1 Tax=Embleya sp. NPDC008237 TaxID=3363978 RepID=UPI0036E2AC47
MTLAHDGDGAGPVVVLLHSSVCDRRMWDPQWSVLIDAGYRVVRPDLSGFGRTPPTTDPRRDADDVLDLLDTLGIARATLIGSSHGGTVALELAARRPDRVDSLVLLCAGRPGHTPSPALRAIEARERALLAAGDVAGAVEFVVDTRLGPAADALTRYQVGVMQRDVFDQRLAAGSLSAPRVPDVDVDPSAITAPCLVVSGAHDLADFRRIAAELSGALPNARHVELPWAGHLPSVEQPRETTALLVAHLAEYRARGDERAEPGTNVRATTSVQAGEFSAG